MNFFKWLSNIVAIIPGLLILKDALPLPPGFSSGLMAALQEITCCFIVGFAWLNAKLVTGLSRYKFNRISIISICIFLMGFFGYVILLNNTVINSPIWGKPMFIPLWESGIITLEGGFQKYYDKYGVDDLSYILDTQYKMPMVISQIIIYVVLLLIFMSLTATFTILWLKHEANNSKVKKTKSTKSLMEAV